MIPERQEPARPAIYSYNDKDRKWLECIENHLWGKATTPYPMLFERDVKLTWEELSVIFSLIKNHKLPTTMSGGTFGFTGYTLNIYDHELIIYKRYIH